MNQDFLLLNIYTQILQIFQLFTILKEVSNELYELKYSMTNLITLGMEATFMYFHKETRS